MQPKKPHIRKKITITDWPDKDKKIVKASVLSVLVPQLPPINLYNINEIYYLISVFNR